MVALLKTEYLKKPPYIKNVKYQEYKNFTIAIAYLSNEKIKIIFLDMYDNQAEHIILECKRDLIESYTSNDTSLGKRDSIEDTDDADNFKVQKTDLKKLSYIKDYGVMVVEDILFIVILDERCIRLYKLY